MAQREDPTWETPPSRRERMGLIDSLRHLSPCCQSAGNEKTKAKRQGGARSRLSLALRVVSPLQPTHRQAVVTRGMDRAADLAGAMAWRWKQTFCSLTTFFALMSHEDEEVGPGGAGEESLRGKARLPTPP